MIGTRILKIDSELAEIFEVKDGWHPSFRNCHFTITQRQKNNIGVTCANFDLKYLCYFKIDS